MVAATAIHTLTAVEPMPRHVRDAADAALVAINSTQHPNVVKMHDAIDGWVKEANRRGGQSGVEYLALCSARMQRNRDRLTTWAVDGGPLPEHLDGFTINDIEAGEYRIQRAVTRLEGLAQ